MKCDEGFVELSGAGRVAGVDFNFDAGVFEQAKARTVHLRVRILHGGDDFLDSGGDDRVGARRRAALMRTRLESQVERGATRQFTGLFESENFGVLHAGPGVKTASDDHVIAHDDGAHGRIRADPA